MFDASSYLVSVRRPPLTPASTRLQRGFTLVELMAVVVILGILSALAYGAFTRQIRKAHRTEVVGNLANLAMRQKSFQVMSGHFASTTDDEEVTYPARDIFATSEADEFQWGSGDAGYTAVGKSGTHFQGGDAVHGFDALRFMPEGGHSRCGYGTISGWGSAPNSGTAETPSSGAIAQNLYPNSDYDVYLARDWFYAFAICDFDQDEQYSAFTIAHYNEDITNDSFGPYSADE